MPAPVSHSFTAARSRRDWLRAGGLGCLGLSLGGLFRADKAAAGGPAGRAKSCILLFLSGGPPQHETFDPKPDAPLEIRGEFKDVPTSVPGVHFCELLPRLAKRAHQFTVIRSMTTENNAHASSGYFMMTGRPHPQAAEVPASGNDWPNLGAVVGALRPSTTSPLSAVTLPEAVMNNPGIPWPGQNGGFMGRTWDPNLFQCDPASPDFRIDELTLPENMPLRRLDDRRSLLASLDHQLRAIEKGDALDGLDRANAEAYHILTSEATRRAFDLGREPQSMRDLYGRHKFGQSVLLARRLIEAGVRLVQVNFPREPGDLQIGNPLWDTHQNNADRLRNHLCPPFDQAFSALLADLETRGLLGETLVVVLGEFGRTPKLNKAGGRDHWGACFSIALAGAGVPGGRVLGATDRLGGYVTERPVRPPELAATILERLGIEPRSLFYDRQNRPHLVAEGNPLRELG